MLINKLYYGRNSKISKFSKIYPFSRVTNSLIGDYSYISYNCQINNVDIGNYCSIAKGVNIGLGYHPLNFISTSPIFYSIKNPLKRSFVKENKFKDHKKTSVANDVWIGANSIILDGVSIGNGAIIAANSVVNKDVPPYTIVGGVPIKEIRKRFSQEIINSLNESKWWNLPQEFFINKRIKKIFSEEFTEGNISELNFLIKNFTNKDI